MDSTDQFTDESDKSSSVNTLSHTMDIIKAAFPYLDSQTQQSMNLVIKTGELYESYQNIRQNDQLTALSIPKSSIDLEALLTGIREVCTKKEKEFIDMILNFYKAKNLYDTYTTLTSAMASQSEEMGGSDGQNTGNDGNSENSGSQNKGNIFGMDGNQNMMELLGAFLTPEQKSTFDSLSMMLNVMQ